jgi:glutathione S-transferase
MMQLYYTANSPFARKLRIFVRERGLVDQIEEIKVVTRRNDNPLLRFGPTGRVPALLTADGTLLIESVIICQYLAPFSSLSPAPLSVPEQLQDMALEGLCMELMEALSLRARELLYRDPEQRSQRLAEYEAERCQKIYGHLQTCLPTTDAAQPLTAGEITLAAAMATADQALLGDDWRPDHRDLGRWYDQVACRPSLCDTVYPGW